jgi:hypothetical protein
MLVTFHTKAYATITMFGDIAVKLLKLMGHSGTVPSAILADDVPDALERLKRGLAAEKLRPRDDSPPGRRDADTDEPPPVGLATRAFPLIELLEAAAEQQCDVMWDAS